MKKTAWSLILLVATACDGEPTSPPGQFVERYSLESVDGDPLPIVDASSPVELRHGALRLDFEDELFVMETRYWNRDLEEDSIELMTGGFTRDGSMLTLQDDQLIIDLELREGGRLVGQTGQGVALEFLPGPFAW